MIANGLKFQWHVHQKYIAFTFAFCIPLCHMWTFSWASGTYRRSSEAWWFEMRPWTSRKILIELQSTITKQDLTIIEQVLNSHKVNMQSKPTKNLEIFLFTGFFYGRLVISGCEAFLQWWRSVSARITDANCEAIGPIATFLKGPWKCNEFR